MPLKIWCFEQLRRRLRRSFCCLPFCVQSWRLWCRFSCYAPSWTNMASARVRSENGLSTAWSAGSVAGPTSARLHILRLTNTGTTVFFLICCACSATTSLFSPTRRLRRRRFFIFLCCSACGAAGFLFFSSAAPPAPQILALFPVTDPPLRRGVFFRDSFFESLWP